MAARGSYPAFPMAIMRKSRKLTEQNGLHVTFDNPIVSFESRQVLPGYLSKDIEAWFLFYGASNPVHFRVAIGSELDPSKPTAQFLEVGVFDNVIRYKADYPNTSSGATGPNEKFGPDPNVPLPAHRNYFWLRFVFTGDKNCDFYLDETKLGYMNGYVDITKAYLMTLRSHGDVNQCRLMEMHFICPGGTARTFFLAGKWLLVRPATCFSPGGYFRLTGEYEQTDPRYKRITFDLSDYDKRISIDRGTEDSVPETHQIIFGAQGNSLTCFIDGEWKRYGTLKEGWRTVGLMVYRNFRIHKVEVFSGANKWNPA